MMRQKLANLLNDETRLIFFSCLIVKMYRQRLNLFNIALYKVLSHYKAMIRHIFMKFSQKYKIKSLYTCVMILIKDKTNE